MAVATATLDAIREVRKEQDAIVVKIGEGMDELGNQAEKIADELQLQGVMIDKMTEKMGHTETALDTTNRHLEQTKKPWTCYAICLVLLLMIGIALYWVIAGR